MSAESYIFLPEYFERKIDRNCCIVTNTLENNSSKTYQASSTKTTCSTQRSSISSRRTICSAKRIGLISARADSLRTISFVVTTSVST